MAYQISEAAFERIYGYLQHEREIYTGNREAVRTFMEAVFWMARSGAQWRRLPKEYGYWNTVYRRFERWRDQGVFKRMFHYFSQEADLEWLMIDSTIVRAHQHSAGAKKGGKQTRISGRAAAA